MGLFLKNKFSKKTIKSWQTALTESPILGKITEVIYRRNGAKQIFMKEKFSRWMQSAQVKFTRFMQGRNGVDDLSKFLNTAVLVILIISCFVFNEILFPAALVLMGYNYFRIFSKNVPKRYEENQRFRNFRYDFAVKRDRRKKEWEQRKIYRFFRCPMCKQRVRVPKGRGKICITCPKCKAEFVKKS